MWRSPERPRVRSRPQPVSGAGMDGGASPTDDNHEGGPMDELTAPETSGTHRPPSSRGP